MFFWSLTGQEASSRTPFFRLDPCWQRRSPRPLFKGQGEHHAECVSSAAFVMELKVGGVLENCLSVPVMAAVLTRPLNFIIAFSPSSLLSGSDSVCLVFASASQSEDHRSLLCALSHVFFFVGLVVLILTKRSQTVMVPDVPGWCCLYMNLASPAPSCLPCNTQWQTWTKADQRFSCFATTGGRHCAFFDNVPGQIFVAPSRHYGGTGGIWQPLGGQIGLVYCDW